MSYALLCLHLDRNQEIEAVTRKVLDLNPGEMLRATAYATLDRGAAQPRASSARATASASELLDEGQLRTSPRPSPTTRWRTTWRRSKRTSTRRSTTRGGRWSCAPEELKQFPLAALGWVHYKRRGVRPGGRLPRPRRASSTPRATTLTHLGMALLASGEEDRARSVLAQRPQPREPRRALEEKMMECMKDSTRLLGARRRAETEGE